MRDPPIYCVLKLCTTACDQAQRNNQRYQHYCLRWCVILLCSMLLSCALLPATKRYQHYCLRWYVCSTTAHF